MYNSIRFDICRSCAVRGLVVCACHAIFAWTAKWLLCSRVSMLRCEPTSVRKIEQYKIAMLKNQCILPGTHFIRGKMKTSASIKSRFTRSAYLWRLQQLNNCWCCCCVVAFFLLHSQHCARAKFHDMFLRWKCTTVLIEQTNLDEREKMRTYKLLFSQCIFFFFIFCWLFHNAHRARKIMAGTTIGNSLGTSSLWSERRGKTKQNKNLRTKLTGNRKWMHYECALPCT